MESAVIKIQKWYRGNIFRAKRLPNVMYMIQKYLKIASVQLSTMNQDGRINSCIDYKFINKKIKYTYLCSKNKNVV
jgi:hypothetical protein